MQQNALNKKKSIRMPDLPEELFKDQALNITYSTSNPPPFLSTTERLVNENGNSDPNYLRSTMYTSPMSEFTLDACNLPFSLLLTPFNEKGYIESTDGVDICPDCRTIFNGFTKKDDMNFVCNICDKKVSSTLKNLQNLKRASFEVVISPLAQGPLIKPISENELDLEIDCPAPKKLLKPLIVFMLDLCSMPLVEALFESLPAIINDPNFQILYENIGFFIINNGLTAFSAQSGELKKYRMPGELPFISQRLMIPSNNTEVVFKILEEIRKLSDRIPPNANTIINTIKSISKFTMGCKFVVVSSCADDLDYESILTKSKNCSINLFFQKNTLLPAAKQHINLEKLAFYSSGQIFRYGKGEIHTLKEDMTNVCLARSVFDVKIVLKASGNLIKQSFIGSTLDDGIAMSHLNHMDTNTTVQFNLGLNAVSKIPKTIQIQVTYTDYDGSRKMRIFNHSFAVGTPSQVFSFLSFDTLFAAFIKLSISEELKMEKTLIDSLVYYRAKCSLNTSFSQFVLPDSVKCLPVLVQAFGKRKDQEKERLINFSPEQSLRYFYPRLFSLSEFTISSSLELTKNLKLSIDSINEDDIFILENSQKIYIYVPRGVDKTLSSKLFDENGTELTIRQSEEEECGILNKIINSIKQHYNYEIPVTICLAGENVQEGEFLMHMVEDKLNEKSDYVDYIFKLHYQVQKG
ncbi:COPII coat Sec23p-Sfb3p heterodimer component [Glugoides intestinalis]